MKIFAYYLYAYLFVFPQFSSGLFLTFTDRNAWIAAVDGVYREETFNSYTTDRLFNYGREVELDDFLLRGYGNAYYDGDEWNRIDANGSIQRIC